MTLTDFLFLIAAQLVVAFVFGELLLRHLPKAIQSSIDNNCHRLDGTWSDSRADIERKALQRVRHKLWTALALVLLPTNMLLLYVDSEVVPLRIGFDAFRFVRANETEWQNALQTAGVESEYGAWQTKHDTPTSVSQRRKTQKSLWNLWPLLAAGTLLWTLMCAHFIRVIYAASLRDLDDDVRHRAANYVKVDLARISPEGS